MGLISKIFKTGFYTSTTAVLVLISSLIFSPPPVTIQPNGFRLPSDVKFEGPLSKNDELSGAEKLYEDQLVGPESFATYQGDIYTGTADGLILKFRYGTPFKVIAHIGDDTGCRYDQQRWRLSQCGRPLGLRFDSVGNLFVLDAYRGIKKIDIRTGFVELVCDVKLALERLEMAPREFIFIDDFVIDEHFGAKNSTDPKNHIFYVSDASSKWPLEFVNHVVLDSDKSGRILKCDSSSGDVEIIDSGLAFPNGLEWTPDKKDLLVNELNERRILKYNIREENRARGRQENQDRWRQKREILASNLPGFPDNIKLGSASQKIASSFDEKYWVALYEGFDIDHINPLYRVLTNFPLLVQTFTGAAHNLGLLLHKIGSKINYPPLEQLGYEIKSLIIHQKYWKSYGLILQLDAKGNILKSLHSPDGVINHLSEVFETVEDGKRILYLGSYFNNYIGRIVLD